MHKHFIGKQDAVEALAAGSVVTIGAYDGVHLGHQAILQQVVADAHGKNLTAVAVVFEPHPREYFSSEQAPARLMTFREKVLALLATGIDVICCLQFDEALCQLTPAEFVQDVLVDTLSVRELVIGDDFRFGRDRAGDFDFLVASGASHQFSVTDTATLVVEGERISSTRIREALQAADFALAERLLGKPYSISGRIMHGKKLGRQWQIPTANVNLHRFRSPLTGVYAVRADVAGATSLHGVANVGVRPTLAEKVRPILEVHLLDYPFADEIYGERMEVEFVHRIRDERKFDSLDKLREQIGRDVISAADYFAETGER